MPIGPMQFGTDNNAGSNQTRLRTQGGLVGGASATLWVQNQAAAGTQGRGLTVEGGNEGVRATADFREGTGVEGEAFIGVDGLGHGTGSGVLGRSQNPDTGNGVRGISSQSNGVQGESFTQAASGVYGENMSGGGFGVAGRSNATVPIHWAPPGSGWGASVFGDNTSGGWAGYFHGRVYVWQHLTKAGGGFQIDHPADPANSYLYHSFVESPDMMNVYNGNTTTDDDGNATVDLPDYFEALNRDFRYQLTVVGQFATAIVAEEVRDNRFSIKTDKPNVMVSWQVTGIRQDAWANANRVEVEVQKTEDERGKYLHPEEHDQPATAGIFQFEPPVSEETEPVSGKLQGE